MRALGRYERWTWYSVGMVNPNFLKSKIEIETYPPPFASLLVVTDVTPRSLAQRYNHNPMFKFQDPQPGGNGRRATYALRSMQWGYRQRWSGEVR
jgi:hypothetical protein